MSQLAFPGLASTRPAIVVAGAMVLALGLGMAGAQSPRPLDRVGAAAVPFSVGEEFNYRVQARWLMVSGSGGAALRVEAIDTVHGFPSYRLVFEMKGGMAFLSMDDVQRSWLDVTHLFSRRFEQKLNQTRYMRDRVYDFFPQEMRFVRAGMPDDNGKLASAVPLDDVSFIYHVRTLPLLIGSEYVEPRYYRAEGNPVTVRVLRSERVTVPAGTFDAIVVQPVIRTEGLFREGGQAEVWLSNDDRRLVLKLRAKARVGTVTMELQSYKLGGAS